MKPTSPATGERRVIYLDHAATTPMRPQAVAAMTAQLTKLGNASSLHGSGREARRVVEEARETIGAAVGASPSEVVFTCGGTESNNLTVAEIAQSVVEQSRHQGALLGAQRRR